MLCKLTIEGLNWTVAQVPRSGQGPLQLDEEDTTELQCNTTKDKKAIRATSAGVLAVVWSCGIIMRVEELFGAESRSQVYILLMTLWGLLTYVPPFFFYDDACHLCR